MIDGCRVTIELKEKDIILNEDGEAGEKIPHYFGDVSALYTVIKSIEVSKEIY